MGKDVDRDKNPHLPGMGKNHGLLQVVFGKIGGMGPQAELLAAQVNGIGPVMDDRAQFLETAGRGKQLAAGPGMLIYG